MRQSMVGHQMGRLTTEVKSLNLPQDVLADSGRCALLIKPELFRQHIRA